MTHAITDTDEQNAIYDEVANGVGNVLILARAGSGKTTTVERATALVPEGERCLFLAFATTNAGELKNRIKQLRGGKNNFDVATCHSFGLRCLRETLGEVEVVKDKAFQLSSSFSRNRSERYALVRAVGLAKGALAWTTMEIEELCDELGVEMGDSPYRFCRKAADMLSNMREVRETVDFDDMIWLPAIDDEVRIPAYDKVFIDEVQDLTASQIELALKACKRGGRVIAVGDDRQGIFRFRGADSTAIERVKKRLRPKILPLTTSFRCARRIISSAQKIVPDIKAREDAPEGVVRETTLQQCLDGVEYGDFVLSRTNAPLIKLALSLVADNCRVAILGREISSGLVSFIYRMNPSSAEDLLVKIRQWASKEQARQLAHDPPREAAAALARDKRDCVEALCAGARGVDEVVKKLQDLFPDEASVLKSPTSMVTLATTHKAKGLERERVWLLRDTYMRSRRGMGVTDEERNLYYVAVTRAKNELVIVRGLPQ